MAVVSSKRWSFRLSLPKIPVHYGNGNEALYSENGMENRQMWHVEFRPDASGTFLAGICGLLRMSANPNCQPEPIPSCWNQVDRALQRIFTGAYDTENKVVAFPSNYSDTMKKNIAFTLRGPGMEKCCGRVETNGPWKVVTHSAVTHYDYSGGCVHGLITSENGIDLNEAASYLTSKFPGLVRWVSRCVNPDRWKHTW